MDQELHDRWLTLAKQRLSEPGRHSGAARTAILELLARDGQCLLDARQIVYRLRDQRMGSNASVYRTLQQLHQLGLLNRLDGRDGIARYEIADPEHRHHHFINERTGAVYPFQDRLLDQAIRNAAQRLGIEITDHEVSLRTQLPRGPQPDGTGG